MKETITVAGQRADAAAVAGDRSNRQLIFKICASITDSISEINNIQADSEGSRCHDPDL